MLWCIKEEWEQKHCPSCHCSPERQRFFSPGKPRTLENIKAMIDRENVNVSSQSWSAIKKSHSSLTQKYIGTIIKQVLILVAKDHCRLIVSGDSSMISIYLEWKETLQTQNWSIKISWLAPSMRAIYPSSSRAY